MGGNMCLIVLLVLLIDPIFNAEAELEPCRLLQSWSRALFLVPF